MNNVEPPPSSPAGRRARNLEPHAGLLVSGLGLLVIATKLFSAAGFSPTTASHILAERGVGSIGIASALSILPGISPFMAAFLTIAMRRETAVQLGGSGAWPYICGFLWALGFAIAPWWSVLLSVLLVLILLVPHRGSQENQSAGPFDRAVQVAGPYALGVAGAILVASSTNVLAFDNLSPAGKPAFAGSVLGVEDGHLVVLRLRDHRIVRLVTPGTTRTPCTAIPPIGLPEEDTPIFSLRDPPPRYPQCVQGAVLSPEGPS